MSESVLSRVLNLLSYAERSGQHPDTVVMSAADAQAMSDEMTDNPFRNGITIVVDDGCPGGQLAVLDSTQCVGVDFRPSYNYSDESLEDVAGSAGAPREAKLASLRARVDLTPTELWLLDEVTSLDHEHYAAHLEIAKLRAQVAELLPWAQYGARKVREFGDDVVMTIEIANGKVSPLIRPAAQNLLRRVHTGGFGEVGR
jgi:hypothetical protein